MDTKQLINQLREEAETLRKKGDNAATFAHCIRCWERCTQLEQQADVLEQSQAVV